MRNTICDKRYAISKIGIIFVLALFCLILPQTAQAATYYLDAVNGDDANPGTSAQPWKSWSKVQGVVSAGDTVYLTGDFGSITFSPSSPVGTSDNWITYIGWPGKTAPHFYYISFGDIFKDAYIKFVNIHVDPGYVGQQAVSSGGVVNLRGANYVTFEDSYFEGEKIAGEEINQGDFAPYVFGSGSSIISAGVSPATSSFITIKNCTFKNGLYGLRIVQHPLATDRRVEYWTIINNDFSNTAEDCIVTSVSGYHYIADNYFHNTNQYKASFGWPGTPTGDWSDKKWQTVTQDTTNASGIFYEINTNGWFIIFADDVNHRPKRSQWTTWRLDSNPNIYFTPSGAGDNCHTDMIAVQATSHDTVIERNIFHQDKFGAQVIKIEPEAENITFKNNLICMDVYVGAYQILLAGNNTRLYHNTIVAVTGHPYALRLIGNTPEKNVYFYNNVISGAIFSSGSIYSDYNIWDVTPPAEFNEGPHSITVSNLNGVFVDRGNFDFNLAPYSTAINFGDPAYAPSTDILGNPRDALPDAGCYEYGAKSLKGDLNKDGKVNIQDVQACVNHILGKQDWGSVADINKDGKVDEGDVEEIIRIILKR